MTEKSCFYLISAMRNNVVLKPSWKEEELSNEYSIGGNNYLFWSIVLNESFFLVFVGLKLPNWWCKEVSKLLDD